MPGITVLMPVYNGERHVRAAIDSILAQTYRDFEFVIVDDGSTDATHELVSSYRDSRIRQHGVEQCRELAGAPWAASLSPRHSTGRTSVTRQVVGQEVTASASLLADLLSALTVMDIFAMSYWLRSLKERKPSPSRSPSSTSCTSPNCASNSGPSVGSF